MTDMNQPNTSGSSGTFAHDVATDLASGRAVELAEVYALDAVSPAERTAIEDYISAAPKLERDAFDARVRQARETLAVTFTAEEEPPAGLFDRIVAQLPAQPDAARLREERRRAPGFRNWLVGVAAAAVIALGGVGVGAYVANQNDPLNQVMQAQDVRQATVEVSGGGTATVSISPSKDAVVVKMYGVPAPPAGKVYQMWLIPKDGSAPVSQGLMDAEALSKPAVVKGIQSAASLGITVEPVGGSASPTLPTVAAAPLGA
jgi:anti-sigma-K factor RskA